MNRWEDRTMVVTEFIPGAQLAESIFEAAALSKKAEMPVRFKFNGMEITVRNLATE